jgi:hypothetical protein
MLTHAGVLGALPPHEPGMLTRRSPEIAPPSQQEDATAAGDGGPPRVAADTSPTWELELLISGAVLFALFQLPGALQGFYDSVAPHTTRGSQMLLFLGYWYAKAAVFTLISCFVLHLTARAYWVGLVGLNSVFPAGMKWEKTKFGPVTRELYRERLPTLPVLISRSDNLCSVIFSFAFLIVLLFAMSVVLVGTVVGVSFFISDTFFAGEHFLKIYNGLLVLLFVGPVILRSVDKKYGTTVEPGSPSHRRMRRFGLFYYRVQFYWVYGSILTTLFSNIRGKVMYPIFGAFLTLTFLGSMAHTFAHEGLLQFNSYAFFDDDGAHAVRSSHYESQWTNETRYVNVPSIQSDVIVGPYLKLFVPQLPDRHNRMIPLQCPGTRPLEDRGMLFERSDTAATRDITAALACLARLHRPTLNGRELTNVDFQFHTHPRSRGRGVLAYIPTDSMPRGRNVLQVYRVRSPRAPPTAPAPPPYEIVFWK